MTIEAVQGLAEANSLLDRLPDAAERQLGAMLEGIGEDVLAAQRHDVAKRTGALAAGLAIQALIEQLRVRVGLIGQAARRLFYGRIVEFGRRAQTVATKRGGKMRVSALPARPFVHVERPELRTEQRLANFWSQTLAEAGR